MLVILQSKPARDIVRPCGNVLVCCANVSTCIRSFSFHFACTVYRGKCSIDDDDDFD